MAKGKKGTKTTKKVTRVTNPLFEKTPKNFRIGGDIRPKTDITRFVRWPKYIVL
jgi:large subunit ribosomal protein L7Ae